MDAPSHLDEFQDYARRVIEEYPQMDEENTTSKLIQPFLQVLGWSIAFDAEMEHKLQVGSTRKSVDYALKIDDSPVIFVEAKGLYEDMNDSHINQIESYMRVADINWGVLTNGKIYKTYRMDYRGQNSNITKIHEVDVAEISNYKEEVQIISKDSIESGESKNIAERKAKISEAQETLRQNKEDISGDIVRTIEEETNSVVTNYAESMSREFVDDIIEVLDEESTNHKSTYPNKQNKQDDESFNQSGFWSRVEENTDVSKDGNTLNLEGKTYVSSFVSFVEYMFNMGYISESDLPVKAGRTRCLINSEPVHTNNKDMRKYKQIDSDIYIFTDFTGENFKEYIHKLADEYAEQYSNNSEDYINILKKDIGFKINNQGKIESHNESTYDSDLIASCVEKMFNDGVLTDSDVPIKLSKSDYFFLNDSPHKDESRTEEMRRPKKIKSGGYYIETNNSSERKSKIIKELVDNYAE